jgi:hypothetical protein
VINIALIKKGKKGILNLTKAPKLEVVSPIIKANKTENKKQNNNTEFPMIILYRLFHLFLNTNVSTKIKIKVFSIPASNKVTFVLSHIPGLNKPAKVAAGNSLAAPKTVPS